MMKSVGKVYLVGAGPGDPELLTLKAVRALEQAEAIVYDRLVSEAILSMRAPGATLINVGKQPNNHPVPQDEINQLLVNLAQAGRHVVRLKGGDPYIFGRGSEEAEVLVDAGIPFEVVPGITAAQGCAARAGVPLTHRGLATSVRFVTGHCRANEPLDLDWAGLSDPKTTVVVYMGHASIPQISNQLIGEGRCGSTPVLVINNGTLPNERRLLSRLDSVADEVYARGLEGPVLFVIGEVAALARRLGNPMALEIDEAVQEAVRA